MFTFQEIMEKYIIRIPDYQRGYSWSEDNVKDLWQDINNIKGYNHYMGNLTFQKISTENEYNKFKIEFLNHDFKFNKKKSEMTINNKAHEIRFIVDGQQRLTTLFILMQVISEKLLDLKKNAKADKIKKTILNSFIDNKIRVNRLGYIANIPCYNWFKKEILKQEDFKETEPSTFYTNQLNSAKKFFTDKLSSLNELDIDTILMNINQLIFNLVELPNDLNVSLVFETMNNRGRGLTVLEKLKNRLIFLTVQKKLNRNEIDLEKYIVEQFSIIYENLGKNAKRILSDDEYLKAHWLCYFNHSNTKKEEFKEMAADLFDERYNMNSNSVNEMGIYNYCKSLADLSFLWEKLMNNSFNETWDSELKFWNEKLQRMPNNIGEFARPLLLASMYRFYDENNVNKLINIFKNIERHHFIVYLFGYRKNNMNREELFRLAYPMYRNVDNISAEINKDITALINRIEIKVEDFLNEIDKTKNKYIEWKALPYFFSEYEIELGNTKIDLNKLIVTKVYTNERKNWGDQFIYQNNKKTKINENTRTLFGGMIGNLVLSQKNPLVEDYNSIIYNNYTNRVSTKIKNKYLGLDHGLNNEMVLSEEFKQWSPKTIFQRSYDLINFLNTRWNLALKESDKMKLVILDIRNTEVYD